jgi:type IV pilus assembly protein PilA
MEPQFSFNILPYLQLRRRRSIQGFTLAELLVVIVIMAVLAAISLPAILGQAAKARESSGKMSIGLVNKGQSQYRNEKNQFASSFDALAIGGGLYGNTTVVSDLYTYQLSTSDIFTNTSIAAYPGNTADRSYIGGNLMYWNSANQITVTSHICESDDPNVGMPPPLIFTGSGIDCPVGYRQP